MLTYLSFICVLLCACLTACRASTIQNKEALYDKLVTGYHRHVRPGTNQDIPVFIDLGFSILSMKGFDEKTGKFSITGYFTMKWTDARISWNPDDFDGIDSISLPEDVIWVPDLILENGFDAATGLRYSGAILYITYTGAIIWYPANVFDANCIANIAFYPFDVQKCRLDFAAWGYSSHEVIFTTITENIDFAYYTPNGQWNFTSSSVTTQILIDIDLQLVGLFFIFTRRSHHEIINTVLPIILLEVLHVFVFLIPIQSGERMGYATTMLLSITVYMTLVSERLPNISYPNISYLNYFLLSDILSGFILIGCVMQSLRLHHTPKTKRRLYCPGCIFKRSSQKVTPDPPDSGSTCEGDADGNRRTRLFDMGCLFTFVLFSLVKIITLFSYLGADS